MRLWRSQATTFDPANVAQATEIDTRVAGYWGDGRGRDINSPGSWGLQSQPAPKPTRFSVSYHLLRVESGAREAPMPRPEFHGQQFDGKILVVVADEVFTS